MILKYVYLLPEKPDFTDEISNPFSFETRSLCNFVERHLKKLKFTTVNYARICFLCKLNPKEDSYLQNKTLMVEIDFNVDDYVTVRNSGNNDQLNEYFILLFKNGLNKCEQDVTVPDQQILGYLEDFRDKGYVNQWTHKKRLNRELGIKATLNCNLTTQAFHLDLVLEKNKDIIFSKEVFQTLPDEIIFEPFVKDIVFEGNKVIVKKKLGDHLLELDLETFDLVYPLSPYLPPDMQKHIVPVDGKLFL